MTGLELKAVEQAAEKSEGILKTLFKESFEEWGGMIADNVRLRRFKNQVKIFEKAQQHLKDKKIDPKKVSLKVLAPLLEFTSLEEEPTIQDMWANLTVNILEKDDDTMFHQNAIGVLNKLSAQDVELLNFLYAKFCENVLKSDKKRSLNKLQPVIENDTEFSTFEITKIALELEITGKILQNRISNLVGLNLVQYISTVDLSSNQKFSTSNEELILHVAEYDNGRRINLNERKVYNGSYIALTPFCSKLLYVCTTK